MTHRERREWIARIGEMNEQVRSRTLQLRRELLQQGSE